MSGAALGAVKAEVRGEREAQGSPEGPLPRKEVLGLLTSWQEAVGGRRKDPLDSLDCSSPPTEEEKGFIKRISRNQEGNGQVQNRQAIYNSSCVSSKQIRCSQTTLACVSALEVEVGLAAMTHTEPNS